MSDTADPPRPPTGVRGDAPRQARAVATRGAILAAAAEEFASGSYHEASLSRILERSKVTKGALYFHFVSKESIALAVVDEMEVRCRAMVERADALGLDPLRTAAQIAREMQDALDGPVLRAGQRLCTEGFAGPQRPGWPFRFWEETFTGLFERAAAAELLLPSVDPSSLARTMVDMSGGAFAASLAITELTDLAQRVCENWELVLGATAVPAWLAAWRADGGMRAVLGPHVVLGVAEGRGWVPGV
ncbi:TetR/AcrR family transcriptional regulator [Actinomycetospora lemnae]|uniref:TetR/AcrR family transcriptional regulator n=1 Tax=Actinomycetospora lemnae TaxID=3019891 RepID=A0ABT5SSM3_9PSEU|nr:TetR/AcrR family transcriptional regulator [Actinomycetospora sp. DW7H6]MDD7965848.1 TetR/AcrR family transcriptional regulator [Actinomycetospora sp. DW7H6]